MTEISQLYRDREKKRVHVRYSAKLPYKAFMKVFREEDISLVITWPGERSALIASAKTKRRLAKLAGKLP